MFVMLVNMLVSVSHLEVARGAVAVFVRSVHSDVLVVASLNHTPLWAEGDSDLTTRVTGIDLGPQVPEVHRVLCLLVHQLDHEALGAGEGGRGVVGHSDVDLADGHVAIVVIGDVLNHHVLEGGQGEVEPIGSDLSPRNAAAVVHCYALGWVKLTGIRNPLGSF